MFWQRTSAKHASERDSETIPQSTVANTEALGHAVKTAVSPITAKNHDDVRVFVFGGWASEQIPFDDDCVNIFVGVTDHDPYNTHAALAVVDTKNGTVEQKTITVESTDNKLYRDKRIRLTYGETEEFLEKKNDWEYSELTIELVHSV
jgi:hypothetical protein